MEKELLRSAGDRAGLVQRSGRNGKGAAATAATDAGMIVMGGTSESGEGSSRRALSRPRRLTLIPARLSLYEGADAD